jgi:hypothetical protein
VLDTNARGYCLEHFPSIMHGEFGFSVPLITPVTISSHSADWLLFGWLPR